MKQKMISLAAMILAVAMMLTGCASGGKSAADKYPERDINMTVPFNAGGSTDLTGRSLGEAMGDVLGTNIVVTNTPGAGGSVGSQTVLNGKTDGYTILADGMLAFTSMPVMNTLKTMPDDWDIWLATFTPNVIAVGKDSPYQTMDELIAALESGNGQITAGTAGAGSAGHIAAELVTKALGVTYKHVPYEGGNPAIVATLSGEVDFAPQLLVEMRDMIISGDIRALACFSTEDIELEGGIVIPSILNYIPGLADKLPMGETTGIAIPKGTDEAILAKLDDAFEQAIKSDSFIKFCEGRSFEITGMGRAESAKYVNNLQSIVAWTLYDAGVAKVSPEEFDIAKP